MTVNKDEIRRTLDAATPGRWVRNSQQTHKDHFIARVISSRDATEIASLGLWSVHGKEDSIVKANWKLITNAPTLLRALLAELDAKDAEIERLRNRYRPAVQWFTEQMERKLRENDHKGGWENENIYWLWERLREESKELIYAVNLTRDLHADPENIVRESADVANFAMMIADVARRMKEDGE